jgi:hypothetical protein
LVAIAGAIWLGRTAILRGCARLLIADERAAGGGFVWIRDSDLATFQTAARVYREQPATKIILVARFPSALVRAGILERFETIARRELAARGVPAAAIEILGPEARTNREEIRRMSTWLEARPARQVALLWGQFSSARQRQVLDETMPAGVRCRVKIRALPNPRYNDTNWWHSREGVRSFMFAVISRTYSRLAGTAIEDAEDWDPERDEAGFHGKGAVSDAGRLLKRAK